MGVSTWKVHIVSFPTAKVLIFSEPAENSTNFDGLTPVFLMSSCLRHHALRFVASLPLSVYATSTVALYAATLSATTILPRKARRDPKLAIAFDASKYAFAYDTPPFAFAK